MVCWTFYTNAQCRNIHSYTYHTFNTFILLHCTAQSLCNHINILCYHIHTTSVYRHTLCGIIETYYLCYHIHTMSVYRHSLCGIIQTYYPFISVINQLDAQNFRFTISLFHASTCFEHMCSSSGGQNCITQPLVSSHL